MTVAEALRGTGLVQGDARRLMAAALGIAPGRLTLVAPEPLDAAAAARFDSYVARRAAGEPVARILGWRDFWGRRFRVSKDVLDPRPETETLVGWALERPYARVLDLGTGSGCLLVTLLAERPGAAGCGTDISEAALEVARDNAAAHGVAPEFRCADWWADVEGRFDLIVSNPPYIAAAEMADLSPDVAGFDPGIALSPGGDGLGAYRAIAAGARARLAPGGRIGVEIGWRQAEAVTGIFRKAGLDAVTVRRDLDGRDRVVTAEPLDFSEE